MSIYKIYKITNAVNGKVYIGQTKDSLHRRFQGHCWASSGCKKLKHAIRKYGKDVFSIMQIDHAESAEEANNKEMFWIDYYKSQDNRFGYNILQGGVICRYNGKKVMCLDTGEIYVSATAAAKDIGKCSGNLISEACIGRNITAYGMRWAFVDKNNLPVLPRINKNIKPLRLKIKCLETGEIFNSIADAARQYNVYRSQIYSAIDYGHRCKGLHFNYYKKGVNCVNL